MFLTVPDRGQKLFTLEAGRFLASVVVMFMHYTNAIKNSSDLTVLGNFFIPGHVGVPYFFVLSGFIICHVHANDLGKRETVLPFFTKRAVRIYPMFLLVSVPMLIGFYLIPSLAEHRDLSVAGIFADLLLLPHSNAILSISWTLRHELVFYVLFAGALVFGLQGFWLIGAWMAVTLIGSQWPDDQSSLGLWSIVGNPLNFGFAIGILCALAVRTRPARSPLPYILLGIFGFVAFWSGEWALSLGPDARQQPLGHLGIIAVMISAGLMIYGLAALEQRWTMPLPHMWSILGGASYVLYLVHQPLASVLLQLFPGLDRAWPTGAFVLLSVVSVLVAVALHVAIERPLLRNLRSKG